MKRTGALLVFALWVFAPGNTRFLLQSETRSDYSGSATNNFVTAYTYDAQGNRLLTRVWDGLDSLAAPISKCNYSYSADGQVSEALLLSQVGDTLSIVRHAYAGGLQVAVKVLRKDMTMRYCAAGMLDHAACYDLPAALGKGRYVLSLACGGAKPLQQITITR